MASIGNYDGVHRGHQHVISTLLEKSQELNAPSTVVTFEPLAKEFFSPDSVPRLMSIEQRADKLMALGVENVLCIEFNADFANYSPQDFIQQILVDMLGVKYLCVGDDFRFGRQRAGGFSMLEQAGGAHGFEVAAHETFELGGVRVSSGRVREALANSDFSLAEALLGHAYTVKGDVSQGQQLGRTMNFPTANIVLPHYKMPVSGVFAVMVEHGDHGVLKGVANVGARPTVDGNENRLEVHLFDFAEDIYGHELNVRFIEKIRDEQKFASLDLLKQQIQLDAAEARRVLVGN